MVEEFGVYGLPGWSVYVVGFLKVLFAVMLLVAVGIPWLALPGAIGLGLLMLGAIIMHLKVGDPMKKSLPAFLLLLLCGVVAIYSAINCGCVVA